MSDCIAKSYQLACEKYAEYGVDVAKAVENLNKVVSVLEKWGNKWSSLF